MKKILITSLSLTASAVATHAQVLNQWNFDDANGTDLGSAVDSVGSSTFSGSLGGGGTFATDGSGSLTGLARIGNADIADQSTGIFQLDMTGVTFTSFTGGTDDSVFFGTRGGGFVSGNNTGFNGAGLTGTNQATIVFGNENDSGGVDIQVYDNNTSISLLNDVTADFSGTWDFRIIVDYDNNTADYLYQINGGGYNNIVAQQFNSVADVQNLALGSNGFGASVAIDQVTWSAVPEPSAYALIAGSLALGWIMIRRR